MRETGEWVLTVSQLTEYVRKLLAADPILRNLNLKGEISNFKLHTSGHMYFTLKDSGAQIRCVMFRTDASGLSFVPRDGMRVILTGAASLYEKDGQFQFYAKSMKQEGVGELFLAFNELKERLLKEGLFDASLKKPLPLYPSLVGIATSETGAALQDILRVARRRNPYIQLVVCPCGVQGERAADEVVLAIKRLERAGCDALIVGRGGGSLEELWTFNEEKVARAVFACAVPVVSAVGHETDFTIIDFVSDVRAPTPSAAAEMVIPEWDVINGIITSYQGRAAHAARYSIAGARMKLSEMAARLARQSPVDVIGRRKAELDNRRQRLMSITGRLAERNRAKLSAYGQRLTALNPNAILSRGYAMVTQNGHVKTDVSALDGGLVRVNMRDGAFDAGIMQIILGGALDGSEKENL